MQKNNQMPREKGIDQSFKLLREGYSFILNRREHFGSDVFETRLLGQKAICMVGEEAAKFFYDTEKFEREGAAPNRVVQTLFGEDGGQSLGGEPHKHRKEMFMSIMTPDALEKMNRILETEWDVAVKNGKKKK